MIESINNIVIILFWTAVSFAACLLGGAILFMANFGLACLGYKIKQVMSRPWL